jgi:hypothetical protein
MIQIDIVVVIIIPISVGVGVIFVLGGIRRNRRGSIGNNTGSIGRRSIGFITTGNGGGGGGGVGDHPIAIPRSRIICRWDGSCCC